MPNRLYLAHVEWIKEQQNNPSTVEWYLMQLCYQVKRIFDSNATLDSCRMKFSNQPQVSWEDSLSEEDRLQYDKAICLGGLGYVRTQAELLADGVQLDD